MSEQDFAVVQGNRYRGYRYSNFTGAGIDPQGNVSSAAVENAQNISNNKPYNDFNTVGIDTQVQTPLKAPSTGLVSGAPALALNAALPYAGSTIGGSVGGNIAAGEGAEQGFKEGISAIGNKVSQGLIGSPATNTVSLAAKASGVYGPPAPSAVSKIASGANIGSAFGTGLGSGLATLLTTGSFKEAAKSAVGSGVGYYLGNLVVPGVGGIVGSLLGGLASSFFGSKTPRVTLGANIGVDDAGRLKTAKLSNKGSDNKLASKYADAITQTLNRFADATGIRYKSGLSTETNIGSEDKKTAIYRNKNDLKTISNKSGDIGSLSLYYLKNPNNYELTGDANFNNYLTDSIAKAKSIDDLSGLIGDRKVSQGLTAPLGYKSGTDKKASFYA